MGRKLEGKHIEGLYMGKTPVKGVVTASRMSYWGEMLHNVTLDQPFKSYTNYTVSTTKHIILEDNQITKVLDIKS